MRIYQQTRFIEPRGSGGTDRLRSYRQNPKRTDSVVLCASSVHTTGPVRHSSAPQRMSLTWFWSQSVEQNLYYQKHMFPFIFVEVIFAWSQIFTDKSRIGTCRSKVRRTRIRAHQSNTGLISGPTIWQKVSDHLQLWFIERNFSIIFRVYLLQIQIKTLRFFLNFISDKNVRNMRPRRTRTWGILQALS